MTIDVPTRRERGKLRCGSCISPTIRVAAFQPEYEYITKTRLIANGALITRDASAGEGANEIGCGVPRATPATRNASITPTFRTVQTIWNALLWRMPRSPTSDTIQTTHSPRTSGGTPGRIAFPYWPKAMAASATGAAKPTVADSHPARKPTAGWYVWRKRLYTPLERGNMEVSSP